MLSEIFPPISAGPLHDRSHWQWDTEGLSTLLGDLVSVDRVTEQSFLQLGDKISLFHGRAHSISELAGEVLQALQGGDGENTLQQLQLLVERCSLWLTDTQQMSVDICNLLGNLASRIGSLEEPVFGLKKVIKTLHSLRVSTRIEAAKSNASGADVLAKSLDELGGLVQGKIADIQDRTSALVPQINQSLAMEEAAQAFSITAAMREVESARQLLSAFMLNQIETGQWSDQLKGRSDEVTRNFGEIVAALQFQDITRQRLDHVRKALGNLSQHLKRFDQRTDHSKDKEAAGLFARICQLQHDQLSLAGREFLEAADNLSGNLQGMATNVALMAEDTKFLLKSTDANSTNRFNSVLDVLRSIADCLQETQSIHLRAGSILTDIGKGVQQIAGLVDDVEVISEEMQLLAMNAAISAAHTRKQGAGLDVIAQNIQMVAEEATRHALDLAEECCSITERAQTLRDVEKTAQTSYGSIDKLLLEAHERMSSLDAGTNHVMQIASRVDRDAVALCDDVAEVVGRFDLKAPFQEKLAPALKQLAALGEWSDDLMTASQSGDLERLFDELELCYTMASERHIHERFMDKQNGTLSVAGQEESSWSTNIDHGLGENVDLF